MTGDARAICPQCGAPLFARAHGDLTCVQHGHWIPHEVVDSTFGAGAADNVRRLTAHAKLTPRKCPDDRYEMSFLQNDSGSVQADACARCGGVWMPLPIVERLIQTGPAPSGATPAEARSLFALGAVRALVAGPASAHVRR